MLQHNFSRILEKEMGEINYLLSQAEDKMRREKRRIKRLMEDEVTDIQIQEEKAKKKNYDIERQIAKLKSETQVDSLHIHSGLKKHIVVDFYLHIFAFIFDSAGKPGFEQFLKMRQTNIKFVRD